jgi:hypothetical protein
MCRPVLTVKDPEIPHDIRNTCPTCGVKLRKGLGCPICGWGKDLPEYVGIIVKRKAAEKLVADKEQQCA